MTDLPYEPLDFDLLAKALNKVKNEHKAGSLFKAVVADFIKKKEALTTITVSELVHEPSLKEAFLDEADTRQKLKEIHGRIWGKLASQTNPDDGTSVFTAERIKDESLEYTAGRAEVMRRNKIESVIKGLIASEYLRIERYDAGRKGNSFQRTDRA